MNIFGATNCPLSTINVTVRRTPAVTDGSNFKVKIRVTRVSAPNANKGWGEKQSCETAQAFKKLAAGTYRITAEPDPDDGYYFDIADAKDVVLPNTPSTVNQEIVIRPLTVTITPNAPWKQYINLELTTDAVAANCQLVRHDVQETRAAAALVAANTSGNAEWIRQATAMNAAAFGKRMNPKQLGRVVEVEARINHPMAGVKVYFAFRADGGNPAWAGTSDDSRVALSRKPLGSDSWERTAGTDKFVKTDENGVAKARLRLSRFGGDKYKVFASLKPNPLSNGKSVSTGDITVWRKIWYQPTYHESYPLYSLAQAEADFARCFIEFEMIDPRPYGAGVTPGATEQDAWQLDEGDREGKLAPGQSAQLEAVVQADTPGPLPRTADADFEKTTAPAVTVTRKVTLRRPAALSVTGADVTLPAKKLGEAFSPLSGAFTVQNTGDVTLRFTVAKTKPWLRLRVASGKVAGGGSQAVQFDLDGAALSSLDAGDYQDTLTFTNAADGTQSATKTVRFTVQPNPAGVLAILPADDLTVLGAVHSAFAGTKTWTLLNKGAAPIDFSVPPPGENWVDVTCVEIIAARRVATAKHAELEKEVKAADARATELEQQEAELDKRAKAAEDRAAQIAPEAAPSVKELAEKQATTARTTATEKKKEAEEARTKVEDTKKKAATAKDRSEKDVATLDPGASAWVTATIKGKEAAALGALPATSTITFKDETNNTTRQHTVRLAKPGVLTVTGADIAKTKQAGDFDATSGTFTLKNDGGADINYAVSKTVDWVTADVESGTLAPAATVTVTVTVSTAAANTFETGTYATRVKLTDTTNAVDVEKNVTLTVTANPAGVLAVTPWDDLDCVGAAGGPYAPATRMYTLKNIGGAALEYEATTTETWLTLSTPGRVIAIGDHNKVALRQLRQQPANVRPQAVQLLICRAQCDPTDCKAINKDADSRTVEIPAAEVLDKDGENVDVAKPALDGTPLVKRGKWEWDGHTGRIKDAHVSLKRGREFAGDFVLNLPATCGNDCKKVGCAKGVAITPTAVDKLSIKGLVIHGHQGFLGEGGYEDRPTCLIVSQENQIDDFNDTVSHEIGHMMMGVLHEAAYHQGETKKRKDQLKKTKKDLKTDPTNVVLQANKAKLEEWIDHGEKNHRYYWPKGVPVHPLQYDEHQGNHCGFGGTSTAVPVKDSHSGLTYADGTCILYDAGRDVKLSWCQNCVTQFTFVDLRRFYYTE
jgi:hypothetical protein